MKLLQTSIKCQEVEHLGFTDTEGSKNLVKICYNSHSANTGALWNYGLIQQKKKEKPCELKCRQDYKIRICRTVNTKHALVDFPQVFYSTSLSFIFYAPSLIHSVGITHLFSNGDLAKYGSKTKF